jgi:hypothetical protein
MAATNRRVPTTAATIRCCSSSSIGVPSMGTSRWVRLVTPWSHDEETGQIRQRGAADLTQANGNGAIVRHGVRSPEGGSPFCCGNSFADV